MEAYTTLITVFTFVVVFLSVIVIISQVFGKNKAVNKDYPYQLQKILFTPAERSFYGVLNQAIGGQYRIFGKVRVADVITPKQGLTPSHRRSAFNRIKAKHFDFVLCRPDTLAVEAVVELDDKSHQAASRKQRDVFLNNASAAAGLPIIRFPVKAGYSISEVKTTILQALGQPAEQKTGWVATSPEPEPATAPPAASPEPQYTILSEEIQDHSRWRPPAG